MKYNVVGEQNILVFLNRLHSAFIILNIKVYSDVTGGL